MKGEKLLNHFEFIDDDLIQECYFEPKRISSRKRRMFTLIVAATLTLALVAMASAAMYNKGSVDILNYLGLGEADTSEIGDGVVAIECSDQCVVINSHTGERETVAMKALSSIGDKRNVFIKIETDIVPREEFDEERDYYLPDTWRSDITNAKGKTPSGWASTLEGRVEDGKLCFYMSIEDCEGINESTIQVTMEDIYLYHDKGVEEDGVTPEEELVCDGSWELNWTYDYKAAERSVGVNAFMEMDGQKYYVRDVQITPFEVNVRAWAIDDRKTDTGLSVEEIRLADGSQIYTTEVGGGGRGSTMLPIVDHVEGYANVAWLGYVLSPADVVSIVVDGVEFEL